MEKKLTLKQFGKELKRWVRFVAQEYKDGRSYPIHIVVQADGSITSENFQEYECSRSLSISRIEGPAAAQNWYDSMHGNLDAAQDLYSEYLNTFDEQQAEQEGV